MYNSVAFDNEMHRRLTNGNEHENDVVEPRYRYKSSIDTFMRHVWEYSTQRISTCSLDLGEKYRSSKHLYPLI